MGAAYATRQDLIYRVAGILKVAQAGQDLETEDAELIDGQIDSTCDSLAARGIIVLKSRWVGWQIPNAILQELAACVAANIPDYGQASDSTVAEQRLKMMQRSGPSYEPQIASYF